MSSTLLVELFCEELPPKALRRLGEAFAQGLHDGLAKRSMLAPETSGLRGTTPPRSVIVTGRCPCTSSIRSAQRSPPAVSTRAGPLIDIGTRGRVDTASGGSEK